VQYGIFWIEKARTQRRKGKLVVDGVKCGEWEEERGSPLRSCGGRQNPKS